MNLGNLFIDKFLDGTINPSQFILLELKRVDGRLNNFLYREFSNKRIRVNVQRLKESGKCPIAFGKSNEWWLIITDRFDVKMLPFTLKDRTTEIDYTLSIANKQLTIVAVKKWQKEKRDLPKA